MIRFNLWLLSILCVSGAFKVMNLNMYNQWRFDDFKINDGIRKFANVIKSVDADIVTLQEAGRIMSVDSNNYNVVNELSRYLGSAWSIVKHCQRDMAIVTKHDILDLYEHTSTGVNVRIRIKGTSEEISVWSLNLHEHAYGPYMVQAGRKYEEIIANEMDTKNGRVHNIVELITHPAFAHQIANSHNVPVIVAGGFNTPSHLDWIEETKNSAGHRGLVIDWPVTNNLTRVAGMTDSYREVRPDPKNDPGHTWSVYSTNDDDKEAPKDRVDFIFYNGAIKPKWSMTYSSNVIAGQVSWKDSEWPSDHKAVITEFEHTQTKAKKLTSAFSKRYLEKLGPFQPINKCSLKIIH